MQNGSKMSSVLHRSLNSTLPIIKSVDANYLIDEDGKRYLDACGGAAVSCLGHDNAKVRAALKDQIDKLAFAHSGSFTNEPTEELAKFLINRAPSGLGAGRVMFLGSGSEAMEAALKLARQFHLERKDTKRVNIIARTPSYHGNTLGALATGGHAGRRAPFQPMLMEAHHIDATYRYRMKLEDESEDEYALRMANQLEIKIRDLGPETVMAFVAEPVVGASLGSQPAPIGYFKRIRDICNKYGVLYIADEVMCGMGRTGSLFALEQEGIFADITTLAKGLGAGYQPIAAVMASESVVSAIRKGSGTLWNGHTYMSHSVATAGALAVQKVIEDEGLLENVKMRGDQLALALKKQLDGEENIGDIRGRGLFWTVELVADTLTKKPFSAHLQVAQRIQIIAKELGLMCYPAQGCADGENGDHVLLAPAYNSTSTEIDLIAKITTKAINMALSEVT